MSVALQHPLISVVTPSFNQAGFLPYCLNSVAMQDYPHVEHIVQDGGSTDGSAAILASRAGQLSFWESRPDKGQADAVNTGMRRARGDIVGWLNADDLYFPRTLSIVADFFARHGDIDVVYGSAVLLDAGLGFLGPQLAVEPFDAERLYACNNFIPQPTVFMRRRVWEASGGLAPVLRYALDWDLWCRLAKSGVRFSFLPHFLAVNRLHSATKTSTGRGERLREIYAVQQKYCPGPPVFYRHMRWAEYAAGKNPFDIFHACFWRTASRRFWDFGRAQPWTLGGFWHRGGNIVAREAEIAIPLFQPARQCSMTLSAPFSSKGQPQSVDVFLNGSYKETRAFDGKDPLSMSLPILPEHANRHEIRLALRFARTYGANQWAARLTAARCE